jgi:hypothetical protein
MSVHHILIIVVPTIIIMAIGYIVRRILVRRHKGK